MTNDASVERAVTSVLAQAGRIDVLVNNAGSGLAGISETFTTDQMRALFDVNVFGIQRMLRAVLPSLRGQGEGLVVNIGSILGRVIFPFFGLYGTSKFTIEALSDSYRYELSQLGVDVVLVQPSNYFSSAQMPGDAERGGA
ncbi:MAG TPA: SDR family NAD(P)-dependent oxidoreductase [Caballeronia sp.]|nr:SDR family NAD(P)-dependent oxidoreductase [Caballeronia sp.]